MSDMYEASKNYFEVMAADTPELLQEVFHLRYQMYCVEKRFDGLLYADGLEQDDYDDYSSHVLVRHISSGNFMGTVRLIRTDLMGSDKQLPIEKYACIDPVIFSHQNQRSHTAAISRFVIDSRFARRNSERRNMNTRKVTENAVARDRRSAFPLALLLVAGIVRISVKCNIRSWLSIMGPALNRHLGCSGLDFIIAGPEIDYYGLRYPYYVDLDDVLNRMEKKYHDAWMVVTDNGKYGKFQIDRY